MKRERIPLGVILVPIVALAVCISCGGDSPLLMTGNAKGGLNPIPFSTENTGVLLNGNVLGLSNAGTAGVRSFLASAGSTTSTALVVTVEENPAITTTVGPDGSFTLRGLPTGYFTLIFTRNGAVLGTLVFPGVLPNQEITITVDVSADDVVLIDESRRGIGHEDIEIEGLVEQVLVVDPGGESRFLIAGKTVVAQPGVTTIREGNTPMTVEDVTVGRRVHVKGAWLDDDSESVLAYEIKLQGPDEDDSTSDEKITICHKGKNTITISINAWPAHKAHGDTLGPC